MDNLYWLSDEAWAKIAPHLPHGRPGARRVDDRRVISGIPSHPEDGWTLARRAARVWTGEDHLQSVYALGPKRSLATNLRRDRCCGATP